MQKKSIVSSTFSTKSKRMEKILGDQRYLEDIKCEIDNKAPRLDPHKYYKTRELNYDARRMREIDTENMKIMKRINAITRMEQNVDCWLPIVKYKTKRADAEWENERIMKGNKHIMGLIANVASHYPATEFMRMYEVNKMKCVHLKKPQVAEGLPKKEIRSFDSCIVKDPSLLGELNPSMRVKCFLEVEVPENDLKIGRIVFELYNDVVPQTCANFVAFCEGVNDVSFRGAPFHRIVAGYWMQGGDFQNHNGTGGLSIYGKDFEAENFNLRHSGVGILSMCNNDRDRNDSKFNLTIKPLPSIDGKYVVFGRAIKGISNIYKIEEFGTKTGKPSRAVIISDCGIVRK